jgi:hypothetical protein
MCILGFYFSGVHPVALYHHTLQNMPAIATILLLLLVVKNKVTRVI